MNKTTETLSVEVQSVMTVRKHGIKSTATEYKCNCNKKEVFTVTETIESKKTVIRFDPFTNPGPLAEEEAMWLNEQFPGLKITPGQVRAVISNHARFQKSDLRAERRKAEIQARMNEREARQARHQERMRASAEKKEAREKAAAEREAAKAKAVADKAAKAEKATAAKTSGNADLADAIAAAKAPVKKPVKKTRPTVAAAAKDTF